MKPLILIGLGVLTLGVAAVKPLKLPVDTFSGLAAHPSTSDVRPVPEPSTYVMVLSGAGVLFLFGRIRRRK